MNSSATQSNLLELAKQGNPKAICALMNRHLQPKGITVKAALKDDCLQVLLESAQTPDQQVSTEFIRKGITNLKPTSIERVKIYGRQSNADSPAWTTEFEIETLEKPTSSLEKTDSSEPKTIDKSETPRPKSFVMESTGNKKLDFILGMTVIALGLAFLIALVWGSSQVTAPKSSFKAESAPPTTTDLDSVEKGAAILKGTKSLVYVSGPATDTPVVTLLLPRSEWNNLDEKGKENVTAYAKALVPFVRANPTEFVDIPLTAPIYKEFVRKTASLCTDCWKVEVGEPHGNGSLTTNGVVARGRD